MPPSQYVHLERQLIEDDVFDPEWLCHCFDHAVSFFGHWVESKLYETDPRTHEPLYELKDLLKAEAPEENMISYLIQLFGVIER